MKKINKWGYTADPEGITNYDSIQMFLTLAIGLGLWAYFFILLHT